MCFLFCVNVCPESGRNPRKKWSKRYHVKHSPLLKKYELERNPISNRSRNRALSVRSISSLHRTPKLDFLWHDRLAAEIYLPWVWQNPIIPSQSKEWTDMGTKSLQTKFCTRPSSSNVRASISWNKAEFFSYHCRGHYIFIIIISTEKIQVWG